MLQIEASELLPVKKHDLTLIVADKAKDAQLMQPRQRTRHGFEGQAEIVSNIATGRVLGAGPEPVPPCLDGLDPFGVAQVKSSIIGVSSKVSLSRCDRPGKRLLSNAPK